MRGCYAADFQACPSVTVGNVSLFKYQCPDSDFWGDCLSKITNSGFTLGDTYLKVSLFVVYCISDTCSAQQTEEYDGWLGV